MHKKITKNYKKISRKKFMYKKWNKKLQSLGFLLFFLVRLETLFFCASIFKEFFMFSSWLCSLLSLKGIFSIFCACSENDLIMSRVCSLNCFARKGLKEAESKKKRFRKAKDSLKRKINDMRFCEDFFFMEFFLEGNGEGI